MATRKHVQVYKKRWYVLLIFCINGMMQFAIWNTFSPIETTARAVYKWDGWVIDLIAALGSITFCVSMLPFSWIMDVKGLRFTVLLAAAMQVVGTVLRVLPAGKMKILTPLIYCGQIISCLGGPVCMAAPPLLSSTWFPQHQRTTATAISTVAAYIGFSLSFLIGPAFVDDVKDSNAVKIGDNYRLNTTEEKKYEKQINTLLYFEASVQTILFFVILAYFPSKPPKPPSLSASTDRVDFKDGARKLSKNFNFLLLSTIYGASTGVFGGWCAILYQNLSEYGVQVNENFAGLLGFIAVTSGAISGVLFSTFADRFSGHLKLLLIIFMACSFYSVLLIYYVFTGIVRFNKGLAYVLFSLSGFFVNGTIPLFFELGVELTYPVAEGITSGAMTFFNNVVASLFLLLPLGNIGIKWMLWATVGTCAVSTVLLLFIKERYNRSFVDGNSTRENDFISASIST
ncbi:solute carrier family 49 member 4-like isoform X2 [Xenia sp. Carnegie-2017]|nr:solute carrier family 49 member 4-like isoform X2 [Xenia sp. Carnegie-2017]XP_046862072.1 solute carrier family 49 member 4-like isoform X2 [Xenia sp. Carnegie-2017]